MQNEGLKSGDSWCAIATFDATWDRFNRAAAMPWCSDVIVKTQKRARQGSMT
jgi:hypothetical protein